MQRWLRSARHRVVVKLLRRSTRLIGALPGDLEKQRRTIAVVSAMKILPPMSELQLGPRNEDAWTFDPLERCPGVIYVDLGMTGSSSDRGHRKIHVWCGRLRPSLPASIPM